jgi:LmbE family N-acetylglucosaminyl deacetylase
MSKPQRLRARLQSIRRLLRARRRPPIIWYIPHPDDDALFMAGSIFRSRDRRNILVPITRGGGSGAIDLINAKLERPLSREEFMRARCRELEAAASAVGVSDGDVIWHDLPDGGVHEDDVYRIIRRMAKRHPGAEHRTMTYLDRHRDHAAIGRALRRAYREGVVEEPIFHVPVGYAEDGIGTPVPLGEPARRAKRAALEEYQRWDPPNGRYAVGTHSVKKLINTQLKRPAERVHGPDYGAPGGKGVSVG